ncbi:MAG: helix-turn-helix domain-containing protein [Spirochaetales bacterium]|nr:helix-turn-helix domain-containing protein [Spirochaetales bacterium]
MHNTHIRRPNRDVTVRYFVFIFAVSVLIALPSILLTYRTVEKVLIRQLYATSLERLEQASSAMTTLHFSTIPATVQLFEQKEVQRLMYGTRNEGRPLLDRIELLRHARLSNPIIDSIAVYNYRTDMMYPSRGGPVPVSRYEDAALVDMLHDISHYGAYRYIPRRVGNKNVFTLIVGNLPTDGRVMRGAVVANIDERLLRGLFEAGRSEELGETIIIDRDGTVLSHPSVEAFGRDVRSTPHIERVLVAEEPQGVFVSEIDGESSVVTYTTHPAMGWHFLQTIPTNRVFSELHRARNATLLILGGVFMVAVGATLIASRRLAEPVRKLSDRVRGLHDQYFVEDLGGGEIGLEFIDRTLELVDTKMDTLSKYYRLHREVHRRELLHALLSGEVDERTVNWEEEDLRPIAPDRERVVAVVRLATHDEDKLDALLHLCRGVFAVSSEPVRTAGDRGALVVPLSEVASGAPGMRAIGDGIRAAFRDGGAERLGAVAGISSSIDRDRSLALLYQEALSATNDRFRGDGERLFFYEESHDEPEPYRLPEVEIERLLREIKGGALDRGVRILETLLEEVRCHRYDDFTFLAQYLLYESQRHLSCCGGPESEMVVEITELRSSTHWLVDLHALRSRLTSIFRRYVEERRTARPSKRSSVVERILEAVAGAFTDCNLSPKSIAAEVGLSTNYVRRVFKAEMGVSLSDHITKIRMEECKRSVLDHDVSIKELCRRVGFASYNYFFETFKKHTGMTPVEYRRAHRSVENLSIS